MNTGSDLTVRILYSKNDLRRALYYDLFRKPLFWATAVIPAAIVFFELRILPFRWIVAIAIAAGILLLVPLLRVRAMRKSKALSGPIVFGFSNAGVCAEFVNGKNAADWSLVTGARENSHFIFVNMQRGSFHLIPKAQITKDEAARLREILRGHVQKSMFLFSGSD